MSDTPTKRIGFTGTRHDLTPAQLATLEIVLVGEGVPGPAEAHHGDCVGADAAFHALARSHGLRVVIHPPSAAVLRARCVGDESLPPLPYLERNRDIVDACDVMIACPEGPEGLRSGTWSTIRYARKQGKPVAIVWPDGHIEREGR